MKDKINGLPRDTILQFFADYDSGKIEADAALFSIRKILQAVFEAPYDPQDLGSMPVVWGSEKNFPTEKEEG